MILNLSVTSPSHLLWFSIVGMTISIVVHEI